MYAVRARCEVLMAEWPASSSVLIMGLHLLLSNVRNFERRTARLRLRLMADPTDEHGHHMSDVLLLFERQLRPHPWWPGRHQAYEARRSASSGGQEHWAPPSRGT